MWFIWAKNKKSGNESTNHQRENPRFEFIRQQRKHLNTYIHAHEHTSSATYSTDSIAAPPDGVDVSPCYNQKIVFVAMNFGATVPFSHRARFCRIRFIYINISMYEYIVYINIKYNVRVYEYTCMHAYINTYVFIVLMFLCVRMSSRMENTHTRAHISDRLCILVCCIPSHNTPAGCSLSTANPTFSVTFIQRYKASRVIFSIYVRMCVRSYWFARTLTLSLSLSLSLLCKQPYAWCWWDCICEFRVNRISFGWLPCGGTMPSKYKYVRTRIYKTHSLISQYKTYIRTSSGCMEHILLKIFEYAPKSNSNENIFGALSF